MNPPSSRSRARQSWRNRRGIAFPHGAITGRGTTTPGTCASRRSPRRRSGQQHTAACRRGLPHRLGAPIERTTRARPARPGHPTQARQRTDGIDDPAPTWGRRCGGRRRSGDGTTGSGIRGRHRGRGDGRDSGDAARVRTNRDHRAERRHVHRATRLLDQREPSRQRRSGGGRCGCAAQGSAGASRAAAAQSRGPLGQTSAGGRDPRGHGPGSAIRVAAGAERQSDSRRASAVHSGSGERGCGGRAAAGLAAPSTSVRGCGRLGRATSEAGSAATGSGSTAPCSSSRPSGASERICTSPKQRGLGRAVDFPAGRAGAEKWSRSDRDAERSSARRHHEDHRTRPNRERGVERGDIVSLHDHGIRFVCGRAGRSGMAGTGGCR